MFNVVTIGSIPWTRSEMRKKLQEFTTLFDKRPIADNTGGMKSPHLFLTWFVLKKLNPKAIIESGVYLGQGTWFLENACPDAELHCIEPNPDRIQYKSNRAIYYVRDFSTIDWSNLPKEGTVLFFDDHQNAYKRVKDARWFGFKHILFEDNYAPSRADCYSLKMVFMNSGFNPMTSKPVKSLVKDKIAEILRKRFRIHIPNFEHILPNNMDEKYLRQNLEIYYELPPVFKAEKTRWGDIWDNKCFPTPEPLLTSVEKEYQQIFLDEAINYTWMCYVKLK